MSGMNVGEFRRVFQSGGFRTVGVTGAGGVFCITAVERSGVVVSLTATRCHQARVFTNPGQAMALLHEMGVRKLEVDMSRWSPGGGGALVRRRPDVTARLQRTHAERRSG